MKKHLLLVLLLISTLGGSASHLIGYDLALVNIKNANGTPTSQYKFRLNFYRDANGIPMPNLFTFTIRRSDTHASVSTISLSKINQQTFLYFNEEDCAPAAGQLRNELGIFESPAFSGNDFSSSAGYYISLIHYSRNPGIKNVQGNSDVYSIVMTMDFPKLSSGIAMFNSSPIFKKNSLNFFTVGKPYLIDMQVQDPDGDSLVYSLVKPLDYGTQKPFNEIPYGNGYNLNYNILDGSPDLSINSKTGLMYFIPTQMGKYLIAIKVEEYRKVSGGYIKIGEVRREMEVEMIIQVELPPSIQHSKDTLTTHLTDTLQFGQEYKVNFVARDFPTDSVFMYILPRISPGENILDPNLYGAKWGEPGFLQSGSDASNLVLVGMGNVNGEFRWTPKCVNQRDKPYEFDIVVHDKTCPKRFTDTLHVKLYVPITPNAKPIFISPNNLNSNNNVLNFYATVGDVIKLSGDSLIKAYDSDSTQTIMIKMHPNPNNGASFNDFISFSANSGIIHSEANFSVHISCSDVRPDPYEISFLAYDNHCVNPDTAKFKIRIFVKEPFIPMDKICAITSDSLDTKYIVYWDGSSNTIIKRRGFSFYNHVTNTFDPLFTLPNNGAQSFEITKSTFSPDYIPLRVRMANFDTCAFRSPYSVVHSAVHLSIEQLANNYQQLNWTELEGATVSKYRIWKQNNMNPFALYDSVSSTTLNFIDSNSNSAHYKIEVVRFDSCFAFAQNNKNFSVFSNTVSNAFWGLNRNKNLHYSIFPNPSNSAVTIKLDATDEASLSFYDVNGKQIFKQNFISNYTLNVQDLPKGIYLLKVNSNAGSFVEKVVVY